MKMARIALGMVWLAMAAGSAWADVDLSTKFSNVGSVANTRHNLTQRQASGGGPSGSIMDPYRNDYGEVCVYCHTPHGANAAVQLPLWNHTIKTTTYTTYSALGTSSLTQPITQPGANSLSCLSCHDGQVAIDSIINMPGSGRYQASQASAQDNGFLSTWSNPSGLGPFNHLSLTECMSCHASGAGFVGAGATDFTVFRIGTDLRDDHPIGVRYPTIGPGVDFNAMTGTYAGMKFFDTNGSNRPDKNEVRVYDTGDGHKVECASCHDPHGVPSGGSGSTFNRSFLRVANATSSALCMTCHVK